MLRHGAVGVELVHGRGHLARSVAPLVGWSGKDFQIMPFAAGVKGKYANGTVCASNVRLWAVPLGARAETGAGPRSRMVSRCVSSHS